MAIRGWPLLVLTGLTSDLSIGAAPPEPAFPTTERSWVPEPTTAEPARLEQDLDLAQPGELIVWASSGLAGLRLQIVGERGTVSAQDLSTATDPIALVVVPVESAGTARAVFTTSDTATVRWAWQLLPSRPEGLPSVRTLRAALHERAPRGNGLAPSTVAEVCRDLLDELTGPDGRVETWSESQLAREIGERAGHASKHELVMQGMRLASDLRESAVPLRSSQVLELRLMEARAMARTRNVDQARALLEELLVVLDELHGPAAELSLGTRQDLAACLRTLGDLEGARDRYLEAVDIAAQALAPGHLEHVRLRHNAAVACFELGDIWRSLQLDQEALALLREQPRPIPNFERAIGLQLALTARTLGAGSIGFEDEHRKTLSELESILGSEHEDVLRLKSNLAGFLSDDRRYEPALELAAEVLEARLVSLGPVHPDTLFSRLRLAQVLSGQRRLEEALAHQQIVLDLCASTRPAGDVFHRKARAAQVRTLLGLERIEGARQRSLEWIAALQEEMKSSLLGSWRERRERVASLRPDLLSLALLEREVEADAAWSRAFFELVETARAARAAGPLRVGAEQDAELRELFERHARARRELGERALVPARSNESGARSVSDATVQALITARHELDTHERTLARALDRRGLLPFRPVDGEALAQALGEGAAAWTLTAFDASLERPLGELLNGRELHYQVTLLTADGRLRTRTVRSLCMLETAVARWRAALGVPVDAHPIPPVTERDAALRAAGADLLTQLFGAWLDELGPEVHTIYVCLEGAASLVPLDALPWGDGSCLGDRFRLRPLASLNDIPAASAPSSTPESRRLVALGGVDYGGDEASARRFPPLPGSIEEARTVVRLFEDAGAESSVLLEGAEADRDALHAALAHATHALLSTHGTFDQELVRNVAPATQDTVRAGLSETQIRATLAPLSLSQVALSGANADATEDGHRPGLWTGEDIAAADLRHVELVVLSACDTNRSLRRGGVGLLSLQTALHASGAQRSLTSLWRVKSNYAPELIVRFFGDLLEGIEASEALWRAKVFLRDERGLPPRFWAGWTLSG